MAGLDKPIYGAPAAGETVEDVLARIAPRDMVVLFALGGIRADMADLCERARKLGAKLICITDTASHAPFDWSLRCHTTSHAPEVRHHRHQRSPGTGLRPGGPHHPVGCDSV